MLVPQLNDDSQSMGDISEENQNCEEGVGDFSKPYNFRVVPFNIEQHLEFIDISEDGHLLLGSSNLVTRNWCGSIWVFSSCDVEPRRDESICNYSCESCIACGQFMDNWEKVIIGDDSGKLSIFEVSKFTDASNFMPNLSATHHDGNISSLCLISDNAVTVSAGCDLRINVWDNNSLELQQKYVPAHSMEITSVISSYDKTDQLFSSCGLDGLALLWDPRQSKPASAIFNSDFGLTSVSWQDENVLAAGSIAGKIHLIDTRNKKELHKFDFHNHPVHHITSCPKGMLAACGNSNIVKVWDSCTRELLYTSTQHTALVRWLAWNPTNDLLYSCGFDKKVLSHAIPIQEDLSDS